MRTRGQASIEYVAILLVVAALLATAAVAVPGVGERLVAAVRTGVCIVGGDVCRGSDAAAAGLAPCVMSARSTRAETTVDIAVIRLGEQGEWELALQSDGQAVVTRMDGGGIGGIFGVGVTFSPARIEAEAGVAAVAGYQGGRSWRFPDARAARAFLDAAMRDGSRLDARPHSGRWRAIQSDADGFAQLALADLASAGLDASATTALGLHTEGPRRTLTLDLGIDYPRFFADLPGFPSDPGKRRSWVADVVWENGAAREIVVRTAVATSERLEEFSGRLDLREPGNRAAAARLLRPSTPVDLRALYARIRSHGVIEFSGYHVAERRRGFGFGGRFGGGLGLSHHRITSERRLVDAAAWVRGGPLQRRFDCTGV